MHQPPEQPASIPEKQANLPELDLALLHLATIERVNPRAMLIYFWFARISVNRCGNYPGVHAIAKAINATEQQIWRSERELVERGLVEFFGRRNRRQFRLIGFNDIAQDRLVNYLHLVSVNQPKKPRQGRRKKKSEAAKVENSVPVNDPSIDSNTISAPEPASPTDTTITQVGTSQAQVGSSNSQAHVTKTRAKLTPEDIQRATSSFESMQLYLLYGKEVFTPGAQASPSSINWERFRISPEDPNVKEWTVQAFMGYYWACVSYYRSQRNISLTLPMWSRLAGDINNLLKTMTKWDLYRLINITTTYFDMIKSMVGRAGASILLDEASLTNRMITGAAVNLLNMGQDALQKVIEDFNKSVYAR